jgi:hypothetical protein
MFKFGRERPSMAWFTKLQEFSKITPALIGLTLLLSVIYEASYFYPLSLRFLLYYEVEDFVRNAIAWIPALLILAIAEVLIGGSWMLLSKFRREQHSRLTFLSLGKAVATKWQFYVGILFALFALAEFVMEEDPHPAVLVTNLVIAFFWFAMCFNGLVDAYATAVGSIEVSAPRTLFYSLAFVLILVTQWGSFTSRADLKSPENAWIEVKRTEAQEPQKLHCTVLRELAATVIAICGGDIYAIKTTEIRTVRYELPRIKQQKI